MCSHHSFMLLFRGIGNKAISVQYLSLQVSYKYAICYVLMELINMKQILVNIEFIM
jgi:hypothetical protein